MNGRVLGPLLVVVAVAFTILSCSRSPEQEVNGQPLVKAQQWEYKIVNNRADETEFNKLGAAGWEHSGQDIVGNKDFIFKRRKQ